MSTKHTPHTPGPWTMHPRFDDGAEVRAPVAWCSVASTHDASGSQIIDAAEARANARLIAAAPDLLAALEEAIRDHDDFEDGRLSGNTVATMYAAIAKATKEKP